MNTSWIIQILNASLDFWSKSMSGINSMLTMTPQEFMGGSFWSTVTRINGAMQSIGLGLLVLFFAVGVTKTLISFSELKRPETAIRYFIRFVIAKLLVTQGMNLMDAIFKISVGVISSITHSLGPLTSNLVLPQDIITAVGNLGFLDSIIPMIVALLSAIFIFVCSIIIVLTIYGRFFRIYLYTALSPLPLSAFAGEGTSHFSVSFLKSYAAVCLEGAVIALACILYSCIATTFTIDPNSDVATMILVYMLQAGFSMLVLLMLIRGSERIIKEMMGLG